MKDYKELGRKAFWECEGTDILLNEFPNGCTLQESIDYFEKHGEELEVIGLI